MKNLLIYINPNKDFNDEGKIAIKIQIDNSLDLGWKREDILLVTNFDYEYNGVKSFVVEDSNFPDCVKATVSKINAVITLFEKGMIGDDIYWLHDLDAYQVSEINPSELEFKDMALTDYGRMPTLSSGSIFFRKSAEDIFRKIKEYCYRQRVNEEHALNSLFYNQNMNDRITKINVTYNYTRMNIRSTIKFVTKPIRVVHFHLVKDMIDFFLNGINKINTQIVPERLVGVFNQHGIK